jgi:hypothetical protein
MIEDECGVVGRMRIGRENRSTRRKLPPVSLCPPQIPHDVTLYRTRAATVGSVDERTLLLCFINLVTLFGLWNEIVNGGQIIRNEDTVPTFA